MRARRTHLHAIGTEQIERAETLRIGRVRVSAGVDQFEADGLVFARRRHVQRRPATGRVRVHVRLGPQQQPHRAE